MLLLRPVMVPVIASLPMVRMSGNVKWSRLLRLSMKCTVTTLVCLLRLRLVIMIGVKLICLLLISGSRGSR